MKKEQKHKVVTYVVTCDIDDKNGWIEEHFSYGFAQEAKERASDEGCSSLEESAPARMTLRQIQSELVRDYGKEQGMKEFGAWKTENLESELGCEATTMEESR